VVTDVVVLRMKAFLAWVVFVRKDQKKVVQHHKMEARGSMVHELAK